jgi:hypothetical protein
MSLRFCYARCHRKERPYDRLCPYPLDPQAGVSGSSLRVGRAYRVSFQLSKDSLQGGLNDAGPEIWLMSGDSSQTDSKGRTLQQTSWGRFLRTGSSTSASSIPEQLALAGMDLYLIAIISMYALIHHVTVRLPLDVVAGMIRSILRESHLHFVESP